MWLVQSPPTIAKLSEVNIVYGEKLDYFGINDSERAQRRSQGNCLLSLSFSLSSNDSPGNNSMCVLLAPPLYKRSH